MTSSQPVADQGPESPRIRNARPADISSILKVIKPFVEKRILISRNEADLARLIPHGFVAEAGGEIVGFAALEVYSSKLAEIQCLAVTEECQYQGLGKQLVASCVERAREEQVWELLAITSSDTFLLSCGFDYSLPDQRRALFLRTGSRQQQPD